MKQIFRLFERKKVIINNTAVILTSEVLLYDFSTSFEAPGYAPTIVLIQFFSLKNIGRNYLLEVSIDTVIVEHRTGNEDITCCGIIKLDFTPLSLQRHLNLDFKTPIALSTLFRVFL